MAAELISILGPTASGKSAVAMEVARRVEGEIVSCDSMQIYLGLDIGTAKPSPAEQEEIPHHLIDCVDLGSSYSVSRFLSDADAAIRGILDRGKLPILCGGTGLYARALLYGFELWPGDKGVAANIRRQYESGDGDALFSELQATAPELAAALKENPRRWLRALEVVRITGAPPDSQATFNTPTYIAPEFILMPNPKLSRTRIRRRTKEMLATGWIEETRRLRDQGLFTAPTAAQALGYREVCRFIDGEIADQKALEDRLVTLTARYAKRQRTWFRHQHPNGIQIPVTADDTAESLTDRILGG